MVESKAGDERITINGVPIEFNPPNGESDKKRLYGVNQSAIDSVNRNLEAECSDWRFVEAGKAGGVPIYEWKRISGDG